MKQLPVAQCRKAAWTIKHVNWNLNVITYLYTDSGVNQTKKKDAKSIKIQPAQKKTKRREHFHNGGAIRFARYE